MRCAKPWAMPGVAASLPILAAHHRILAYGLLFLGAAAEGDLVLLSFVALAHAGELSLWAVIALAVVGAFTSSESVFLLAHRRGRSGIERWLARSPGALAALDRAVQLVARRAAWWMLFSRYLIGLRLALPTACGLGAMRLAPFTVVNAVGAVVWAVPVGLAGYAFTHAVTRVLHDVRRLEWYVAAILSIGWIAYSIWRRASAHRGTEARP